MTTPKLVTNPPQGSGLVGQLVDAHYEDLAVRGRPGDLIPFVGLLQPVGHNSRRTKEGERRTVTYEVVRLEPIRDPHEADNIAWEVSRAYERRTSVGGQQALPLHNSPAEKRGGLLDSLTEWATAQEVSTDELNERWVSYFGGPEHAASATPDAGSLVQLMEFTRYVGAVEDAPVGGTLEVEVDPDEDDEGDDPDLTPAAGEPGFTG